MEKTGGGKWGQHWTDLLYSYRTFWIFRPVMRHGNRTDSDGVLVTGLQRLFQPIRFSVSRL